MSRFSFYKAPVRNVVPACTADLCEIHRLITGSPVCRKGGTLPERR